MPVKECFKKLFIFLGIEPSIIKEKIGRFSIYLALFENRLGDLVKKLRLIVPDISGQEESGRESFNSYWELKRRALQAFQCLLMIKAAKDLSKKNLTVVDIGDSAGTHMLYLKALLGKEFNIETISVNLDPRAIEKIKNRGLKAICTRAEELTKVINKTIDLSVSFQMVEHLYNPCLFFRRLAKEGNCSRMLITVPYQRKSRVGFYNVRNNLQKIIFAEDEHIFELNPQDWSLLMLHSGWKVVSSEIYFQYPRRLPFISQCLALFWRKTDFEGFWGALLEKDTTVSDLYRNWEQ